MYAVTTWCAHHRQQQQQQQRERGQFSRASLVAMARRRPKPAAVYDANIIASHGQARIRPSVRRVEYTSPPAGDIAPSDTPVLLRHRRPFYGNIISLIYGGELQQRTSSECIVLSPPARAICIRRVTYVMPNDASDRDFAN